ncbi:hypothetical protein J6590_032793 [Homalodisca vitripennis]|nr:hypothetical protein J6590_032793 [Homalodisca vitripennis]
MLKSVHGMLIVVCQVELCELCTTPPDSPNLKNTDDDHCSSMSTVSYLWSVRWSCERSSPLHQTRLTLKVSYAP